MTINLNTTDVPNREQRLGTIIRWEGVASDLVLDSHASYGPGTGKECGDKSGCGGKNGRKLCELESPFTQGSMCAECVTIGQAVMVKGSVVVQHAPIGCAAIQSMMSRLLKGDMHRQRGWKKENPHLLCSNLQEDDMVFGGISKLEQSVRDAWNRYHPEIIMIATSCATGIIGDDVDSLASRLESELGTIVVPLHCEGFRAKHWSSGFDISGHAILRQMVNKIPTKKQDDLVNVMHLGGPDIYTPMLAKLGLRCNLVMGGSTLEQLRQLTEAAASAAMCTVLSYLPAGLEQEYGIPEVKVPTPYGLKATDDWMREVARLTHREDIVEEVIASEHARILPHLDRLRKELKGKKGLIAAGATFAHGLIAVLRELDVEVDGVVSFHHDPIYDSNDLNQDMLAESIDTFGDVPHYTVSIAQHFQTYTALHRSKPDFIIARHNMAALAARLGIPGASIRFFNDGVGYDGLIRIGELIRRTLATGKFSRNLAAHTSLPYKKWWLDQTDPFVLSRNSSEPEGDIHAGYACK